MDPLDAEPVIESSLPFTFCVCARLMAYGLSLACRGVRHQASWEMFASLSRDEHGAGTANIHAGSALLATGGICMLGDLGCYRKDKLDAILSGMLPVYYDEVKAWHSVSYKHYK